MSGFHMAIDGSGMNRARKNLACAKLSSRELAVRSNAELGCPCQFDVGAESTGGLDALSSDRQNRNS